MEQEAPAPAAPDRSLLGCGCGAVVAVVMAAASLFTFYTWRQSEALIGALEPAEREARVQGVLPHRQTPVGLYPLGAFRLFGLFRMAILTDLPATAATGEEGAPHFGETGFVFADTFSFRSDDSELRAYFTGAPSEVEDETVDLAGPSAEGLTLEFRPHEVIARGSLELAGYEALWVARRGELDLGQGGRDGVATLLYLDCEGDRRVRFGLWFEVLPEDFPAETGDEAAEWSGTPADAEAIRRLLGHFWVCGA